MEQAYWIRYVDVDGVYIVRLMGNMHREGDVFVYDECDAEIPVDELHVLKSKEGFTQYYDKYYGTDTDYDTVNPYDKIRMLEKGVKTIDGYNTVARMSNVYWAKIFDLARMIGVAP